MRPIEAVASGSGWVDGWWWWWCSSLSSYFYSPVAPLSSLDWKGIEEQRGGGKESAELQHWKEGGAEVGTSSERGRSI